MQGAQARLRGLALTAALIATGALAPAASAAYKPYSLTIAPPSVTGGTTNTMTARFYNENSPGGQTVGSANLFAPSGFTVTHATTPTGTATLASSCTDGTLTGPCVQLRNIDVQPGGSLTVSLTVNAPACGTTGTYTWSDEAKQSNDFSGTGNDVSLDTSGSSLTTTVPSGGCPRATRFDAGGEPTDTIVGQPITAAAYSTGGPVKVDVIDANGQVVTSYNGPVSVSLNQTGNAATNPAPATLGGTKTVNAVHGVASFSGLSVNEPGNGYSLGAAGPSGPTATSSSFSIHQAGTTCQASNTCTTSDQSSDFASATAGGIKAVVTSPGGTYLGVVQPDAILSESIDFGTWPATTRQANCPQEVPGAHFAYVSFTNAAGQTVQRAWALSLTTNASLGADIQALIPGQQICFASAQRFQEQTASNTLSAAPPTTMPDGSLGYEGELPTCTNAANNFGYPTVSPNSGPCITNRTGSVLGGTLEIDMSTPYDAWIN